MRRRFAASPPRSGRSTIAQTGALRLAPTVENVKLSVFTDDAIKKWQADYLDKVYADPAKHERAGNKTAALEHARSSLVTTLRMYRVLFRDEIAEEIKGKIVLPDPIPFTSKAIAKVSANCARKQPARYTPDRLAISQT